MSYKNETPEVMAKNAATFVNERYDITLQQSEQLKLIKEELGIPPSAMVRLALNIILPKIKDEGFKYEGIVKAWDRSKF